MPGRQNAAVLEVDMRCRRTSTGWLRPLLPRVFLVAGVLSAAHAQSFVRKEAYVGAQLKGTVLLCKSDQLASGGFWRTSAAGNVESGASIRREEKATTWRITLKRSVAEVIRFSGASQTIEEPEVYSVEPTSVGILLIYQNRASAASPQIITIDLTNSSFVYSSQHVNPLWNRANIFYGSCQPHLSLCCLATRCRRRPKAGRA